MGDNFGNKAVSCLGCMAEIIIPQRQDNTRQTEGQSNLTSITCKITRHLA